MALVHACLPLIVDCGYQPFFAYTLMAHALLFWLMFYNFYNKRYQLPDAGATLAVPVSASEATSTCDDASLGHRQAICHQFRDQDRKLD